MKDVARMVLVTVISIAAFLGMFLVLQWSVIVALALAVGIYVGLTFFLKPTRKIAGIDVAEMPNGEAIADILDEVKRDLAAIRRATRAITDPKVQENAGALYDTGSRILNYLEADPSKIKLARRFFTYYLDMAAKLLERYVELQNTGLRTDEVADILEQTAEALPVLHDAFERQFTHLMQGELLDVEADIKLLRSTLLLEGGK